MICFSLVVLGFGLIFTLFGYKLIKILIILFGFLFCAIVTYVAIDNNFTDLAWYWTLIPAVVAGIIGAIIFKLFYKLAIFALGFCGGLILGLMFVGYLTNIVSSDLAAKTWWTIVCWGIAIFIGCVIGIITVKLERFLIVIVTAILGSYCVVASIAYLVGDGSLPGIIKSLINQQQIVISWKFYLVVGSWGLLSIFGVLFQFIILPRLMKKKQANQELPQGKYYGAGGNQPTVIVINGSK